MNQGAITGWILATVAVLVPVGGLIYSFADLHGKVVLLEVQLDKTISRVDGMYVFIAEHGGSVKKAVMSSGLSPVKKQQIINSLVPMVIKSGDGEQTKDN